jgi:hypothetical protein
VTSLAAPSSSRLGPWLWRLVAVIPVAAAFVLALTGMEDPDAFTHLALGRELVQHHGFPAHEPFSFTTPDSVYYNPEWLFGLVLHLGFLAAGLAGVIVLKAAVVALAAAILWLDSRPCGEAAESAAARLIRAAVVNQILLMIRQRFLQRPDKALFVLHGVT